MFSLGPDEVDQFQSLRLHCRGHRVRRRFLFVKLAAVGNHGGVRQIRRVIRRVIQVPQCLLIPGRTIAAALKLKVVRCVRKAGARRHGGPNARMMRAQMPAPGATHRKTPQRDSVPVNRVMPADVLQ